MGEPSSRRARREEELEDLAVKWTRWKFRFYCWRWSLVLSIATIGLIGMIVGALLHGSPGALSELVPRSWMLGR
jgi:hypothetical protein